MSEVKKTGTENPCIQDEPRQDKKLIKYGKPRCTTTWLITKEKGANLNVASVSQETEKQKMINTSYYKLNFSKSKVVSNAINIYRMKY